MSGLTGFKLDDGRELSSNEKQRLLALFEKIIGEDESTESYIMNHGSVFTRNKYRAKLRADIRKALGL